MFTGGTLRALSNFYRICGYLCAFPYKWDGKTLKLSSPRRVGIFALVCLYFIADLVYLLLNLVTLVFGLVTMDTRQVFFSIAYTGWYFQVSVFGFQIFYYRKETSVFIQELLRINTELKSSWLKNTGKVPHDFSEMVIRIGTMCMFVGGPCFGFLFLWYPDDYQFMYRRIFPQMGKSYWMMGIFCAWEFYHVMVSWAVMQFCWFQFMLHCTSCRFWLEEGTFRVFDKKMRGGTTTCVAMTLAERSSMYRQLQVLNAEYNRINRWLFAIGFKIATVLHNAQSIYCFALMYGQVVLFMYVCFSSLFISYTAIIVLTYSMAGYMFTASEDFIRCFLLHDTAGRARYYRRYAKALYPVGVTVGSFYHFRRSTPLFIIGIVVQLSTNAILMTPSKS